MQETGQRSRVVIENVTPEIDCGRFPVKRTVGESVRVEADAFTDGHDVVAAVVRFRHVDESVWREARMTPIVNDRWHAAFPVERMGQYVYTVRAWVERFFTWQRDFRKRVAAGQDVSVDRLIGAELIENAASQVTVDADRQILDAWAARLRDVEQFRDFERVWEDEELTRLMHLHSPRAFATTYQHELAVVVERERARCSAWYELFPRSASPEPGRHGTLQDVEARLPYVASMGFDVLYLPPVHPIGRSFRKGKNNTPEAGPDDVGSPWAIGAEEGGHQTIHPDLGTLDDFRSLVQAAQEHGLEIAMDYALQCAPDHPYVKEHPEWFRHRPDGTIQYAENPPKKYQDIYPIDFETDDWRALWEELKSIVDFWIDQGVRIFRVDNPHTKPFAFWEWLISETRNREPDVIFLSEAFTRPKVMYRLAKLGFSQSYTYFAWRRTKWELRTYLEEVTRPPVSDFFRPNLWPNTPDILTEQLQVGGRNVYFARFVLAATLGASYGIYGPAFELMESEPREWGSEEYRDSEKYQIRHWDLDHRDSLREFVALVNRIRRENPALHTNESLRFHTIDNEELLCYSKQAVAPETETEPQPGPATDDGADGSPADNLIVVVVNLDPHHRQSGYLELPLQEFGLEEHRPYQAHDLLTGARYLWHGPRNYVELDPHTMPAHVFRIRRHVRTERDFDYFL